MARSMMSNRLGSYLPVGGGFGSMFEQDPEFTRPGKSIRSQDLGTVIGKRGAGRSQITGGDPGAHSLGHYGKKGIQGLNDGGGGL